MYLSSHKKPKFLIIDIGYSDGMVSSDQNNVSKHVCRVMEIVEKC